MMGLFIGVCLLIATVSACGGGSGQNTHSSSMLYSNWIKVDNSLLTEPVAAVTASPDSTNTDQNAVMAAQNPETNANEKSDAVGTTPVVYKASVQNSGSGISGFIAKFSSPKTTATQGLNSFAYSISNYAEVMMSKQKLALAKNFQTPINTDSVKTQFDTCIEQLGVQLCTKGSRVAF